MRWHSSKSNTSFFLKNSSDLKYTLIHICKYYKIRLNTHSKYFKFFIILRLKCILIQTFTTANWNHIFKNSSSSHLFIYKWLFHSLYWTDEFLMMYDVLLIMNRGNQLPWKICLIQTLLFFPVTSWSLSFYLSIFLV